MIASSTGSLVYIPACTGSTASAFSTAAAARDAIGRIAADAGGCGLSAVFDIMGRGVIVSLPVNPDPARTVYEVNRLTELLAGADVPMRPCQAGGYVRYTDGDGRTTVFAFDYDGSMRAVPLSGLVDRYFGT